MSATSICYLCGHSIDNKNELALDMTKEGIERIHHKHCSQVYNRLLSIYGDNFDDLGLDRVKWGSGTSSGDLIELSLYDIRNSSFSHSEVCHSLEIFKTNLVNESINSKTEIVLIFSCKKVVENFSNFLERLLVKILDHDQNNLKIRILTVRDPRIAGIIDVLQTLSFVKLDVNYINESNHIFLLGVIDRNLTFFYEDFEKSDSLDGRNKTRIISYKESIGWHATAAFESLWKQSELEEKIRTLSSKVKNSDIPNNNFVRILAHELKTPIQPILGFSEMIQNNNRLNPEQKNDLLKIISRNARKLDIMTNNILDYARMENNNFKLNYEKLDLVNVLQELISDYSIQINQKKIQIKLSFVKKPIIINADRIRIVEVFDNLISNAIKFTENGQIIISIELELQSVRISIKDDGIGIKMDNLDKVFAKFFTTDKLGTGLGLYISKIIVLKHLGTIDVQNNVGSQGSTFTVTLPNVDSS